MNRYQLELMEMDRRRFWRIRILTIAIAAALIVVAMWSAGVPNESWFGWMLEEEAASVDRSALPEQVVASPSNNGSSETALVLRLIATAPGRNIHEGTAQIASAANEPLTYAAGALLENGTTLIEIHGDHVILARGEETSALYVDGMAQNPLISRDATVNPSLLALKQSPEPAASTAHAYPKTYTDVVRAAPRFENERIVGFDIYPGTSRGHFTRLGFESGDLLIAVDGLPIASVGALHESLKGLSEGRSAIASIERAGKQIDVALDGTLLDSSRQVVADSHAEP